MSSVGYFFSYVNDARSHEPEVSNHIILKELQTFNTGEETKKEKRVWQKEILRMKNKTYKWDVQISVN